MSWSVKILQSGRSGYVDYVEAGNVCRCDWEFGGGDALAIISVPARADWDKRYPCAATIEWDAARNCAYLRQGGAW